MKMITPYAPSDLQKSEISGKVLSFAHFTLTLSFSHWFEFT